MASTTVDEPNTAAMDAFFESMADAISAVVLIATDVEENEKLANNLVPAAKEVHRCSEVLVSIGEEVSLQWEKALDDKAMRQKTDEACQKTSKGCKDILEACTALANAAKNPHQKRILLDGCKVALTNATLLLQLADLYESVKLIKYAEAVVNVSNIFVTQVRVMSDFNTVAQDVMLGSVETAKLTQSRINFLSHPEYKRRLVDANATLKAKTEGYVFAVREAVLDSAGGKGDRREAEHRIFRGALEEIILVCKLSSRDLMDRLNLNFDPLLSGKLGLSPTEEDGLLDHSGLNDAARRLNELLKKLLDALKRGDKPAVEAALREIAAETGKPIPDSFSQAVMAALHHPTKEALASVASQFWGMQGKLVEGDDAFHKRKGMEDDMAKALERLKKALGDLGDATNKKKQPEAIAAAKELAKEVQDLTDRAEKYLNIYPRDAAAMKELERLKNDVKAQSQALLGAVKNALNNPNDDTLKALQDAMDRLRRAANALANQLIPSPTEEMRNIEEVVKGQLPTLPPLAESGDRARAGERADDIAKQLQRAMEIAGNKYPGGRIGGIEGGAKNDPFRSKELDEALRRLRNAANNLKNATGRAANAPQDAPAQKQLTNETTNTGDAMNRLVKAFELNPAEVLVDNAGGFDAALDKISPAAKSGDVPTTAATADRLNTLWDDTLPVVKHLLQNSHDQPLKAKVAQIEEDMSATLPALVKQAKKTAEAPAASRAAEGKALDDLVNKARNLNHDLVEAIIDPEAKYLAERDRMKREMEKLADALRRGDKAAAEAAMDAIKDSAAKQRIYAKALALKATDPKIKKKLLDAALEMQDAVIGVLDAARAALNGTSSVDAAEKAMTPFIQKYDNASNAISSTFGAAPAPPASSREGLDGAAAEMHDLVRNLVVDKTAEGQLFGIAKDLAEAMAKLSAAAKSGNKKEIILCARRIAELVGEVLKQATEAAARCTDKRLSETLLTHAQAAKNFATQLKILTAVKAATFDDDPTVKQQLVKCAKQLAGSMTKTVNAAEISKLRAKK